MTVGEFAERMLQLAAVIPLSEISGLRSRKHNQEVGGVAESAHLVNLGRDIVLDDLADLSQLQSLGKRLGLQVVLHNGGIHIEPISY